MEYIGYSIAAWLILLILGLPISLVVLPVSLRRYSFLFAPLLGFCATTFVSYYLYRANIGGTDRYAAGLFGVSALALLGLCWRKPQARRDLRSAFNADAGLATAVMLIGFAVISAPFAIAAGGRALAASMGNLDIAELAIVSRYLQEFAPDSTEGFLGQSGHLAWTCRDIWFGPSAIVAFVCSLVRAEPFQLQGIVLHVIAVQAIAFVYLLARLALEFGCRGAALIAFLYAISPVPLFTIWQSFGGQMLAMSLMLAFFVVQTHRLQANPAWPLHTDLCLKVLLLSGLLLSYHYMVVVAALLAGACVLSHAYFGRNWRRGHNEMLSLVLAVGLCFALNPLRVKGLVSTLGMLNSSNGWFIPWLGPDTIMGAGAAQTFENQSTLSGRLFWLIVGSAALIFSIWRVYRSSGAVLPRSVLAGLVLPTIAVGLWYAWREQSNEVWGSYRSFKITASFSALAFLGGSIAFLGASWNRDRLRFTFGTLLTIAAIICSLRSASQIAIYSRKPVFLPGPEMAALRKIESFSFVSGMNVLNQDPFSLLWTNYFTLKTRQVYQSFPYGGRPTGVLDQEYFLIKHPILEEAPGIFLVEPAPLDEDHAIGPWFRLVKTQPGRNISITPAEGWWPAEPSRRWTGVNGQMCSIYIDAPIGGEHVRLVATYLQLRQGNQLSAAVNGSHLPLLQDGTHFESEPFLLKPGRNIVEIRAKLPPSPPPAWDPRTLGICWTSVRLEFTPALVSP